MDVTATTGPTSPSADPWDRLARGYRWQEPLEARSIATLLDLLAPRPHEVLLDVGSGAGHVVRRAARPPAARTVAVDRSSGMLRLPRPPGTRALQADATSLPLADASVDVATAAWLLHLLAPEGRGAAVAELARVLRPGGRLGVVVPAAPRTRAQRLVRSLARTLTHGLGAYDVPHDLPHLLTAHGLRVRERRRTGRGYLADVVVCARTAA